MTAVAAVSPVPLPPPLLLPSSAVAAAQFVLEAKRKTTQVKLDKVKDNADPHGRNQHGQFSTPFTLASDIIEVALPMLGDGPVSFLDPAFGTGVFFSALLSCAGVGGISSALAFEKDPDYGGAARRLWCDSFAEEVHVESPLRIELADFTLAKPTQSRLFDLSVCNPPYSRHHHIDVTEKARYHDMVKKYTGLSFSGLSGLHCYFVCMAMEWVRDGGIGAWILPAEFLDVNYGIALKDYLVSKVTLVRLHRFLPEDMQFADAMVSSVVFYIKKGVPVETTPPPVFSCGGTVSCPNSQFTVQRSILAATPKWSVLFTAESIASLTVSCRVDVAPSNLIASSASLQRGMIPSGDAAVTSRGKSNAGVAPAIVNSRSASHDMDVNDAIGPFLGSSHVDLQPASCSSLMSQDTSTLIASDIPDSGNSRACETLKSQRLAFSVSVSLPSALRRASVITRLRDLFDVKRGIATGCNEFFIMTMKDASAKFGPAAADLQPVLPPPRELTTTIVECGDDGLPALASPTVLFSSSLSPQALLASQPLMAKYVESGVKKNIHTAYLCSHRKPWYNLDTRSASMFVVNYMGRVSMDKPRPFTFVLNLSTAVATNNFLMLYPKGELLRLLKDCTERQRQCLQFLNSIPVDHLVEQGRVYAGGLHKLEPSELLKVPADALIGLLK